MSEAERITARAGEWVEVIDLSGDVNIHLGGKYEVKSTSMRSYVIVNDKNETMPYFIEQFKCCDPPSETHETIEIGDWVECRHDVSILMPGGVTCSATHLRCGEKYYVSNATNLRLLIDSGIGNPTWYSIWRFKKCEPPEAEKIGYSDCLTRSVPAISDLPKQTPSETIRNPPDPRAFWLVKGGGPSSYEHSTFEDAELEAKRLAKAHANETFTVLGPICSYCVSDLQRHDLMPSFKAGEDVDAELPF